MRNRIKAKKVKKELGRLLRLERKRLGISILDLWQITDWDVADISNFERCVVDDDMKLSKYIAIVDLLRTMQDSGNKQEFIEKLKMN